MSNTTPAPIFTAAGAFLEDGDVIRPVSSLVRVRGVFDETPGWVRLVVQHVENITGDVCQDVYTMLVDSRRVFDVYAAADAA